MKRLFTQIPPPCSRCCVNVALKVEYSSGLNSAIELLVLAYSLLKPTCRFVPVTNPWLNEKLYWFVVLVPPVKKFVDGWWSRSNSTVPVRFGSMFSGGGPA